VRRVSGSSSARWRPNIAATASACGRP
jgi:hypothetical protein